MSLPSWGFDVVGTVRLDLDRQPVAGATVRFTEQGSGDPFETRTTASGSYVVSLSRHCHLHQQFRRARSQSYRDPAGCCFSQPVQSPGGHPVPSIPLNSGTAAGLRSAGSAGATPGGSRSGRGHLSNRVGRNGRSSPGGGRRGLLLSLGGGRIRGQPKADHVGWEQESAFHGELVAQGDAVQARFDVEVSGIGIETLRTQNVQPFAREFDTQLTVSLGRRRELLSSGESALLLGVPGGSFTMGSKEYQDESPPHAVFLDGYFLQQLEVTQAQYRLCVEAGACPEAASGEACNWGRDDRDDHPANCISWFDASRYCSWAGMRLPTEAEWEKGARGTFGFSYPWGNTPPGGAGDCDRAIMMRVGLGLGCGHDGTGPAGGRPLGASPYGLLDMAGNVWEWVMDDYDRSYYAKAPVENPVHLGRRKSQGVARQWLVLRRSGPGHARRTSAGRRAGDPDRPCRPWWSLLTVESFFRGLLTIAGCMVLGVIAVLGFHYFLEFIYWL